MSGMLSNHERLVVDYLKANPGMVSVREVCRRAGGKELWAENERWATPILSRLLAQKIVKTDGSGHYELASDDY